MKLVWLREDLRLSDNPALFYAAESDDVACVYVIAPVLLKKHDISAHKINFLMYGLKSLQKDLKKKNISLNIITVDSTECIKSELLNYAKSINVKALYFNQQYEANEQKRDQAVTIYFENAGIAVKSFNDQCLFEPGEVLTQARQYFQIYTPFKNACWKLLKSERFPKPLPKPKKQTTLIGVCGEIPVKINDHFIIEPSVLSSEKAAKKRLDQFIEAKILDYKTLRDFPALNATSQLSPYFAAGMLTIHQCFERILNWQNSEMNKSFFELPEGALTWVNELLWREFYRHILVGFPRVSRHKPFKLVTNRIHWEDNQEHLHRWQQGLTGIPIVDAAMRQLNQTGWMHNRLRMIVAMYFSKNLFLDWRLGERYFMQNLIDGDLASNNGGWQWSASTGVDAAPYFRIFNPYLQSKRFDPKGMFIRTYIPELAKLADKAIHCPDVQSKLISNYPKPMVDLKITKQRAVTAFKELNS